MGSQVRLEAPQGPKVLEDEDGVDSQNPQMVRAAEALDSAGRPMPASSTGGLLVTSVVWRGRLVTGRKSWEKLFGEWGGVITSFARNSPSIKPPSHSLGHTASIDILLHFSSSSYDYTL